MVSPVLSIVCLGLLLNVIRTRNHRVLEYLHRADLQHVQDDLAIFRIVLVPIVVQSLTCTGKGNRGDEIQVEASNAEMIHQHAMIVAGGLKTDTDRYVCIPARSQSAAGSHRYYSWS